MNPELAAIGRFIQECVIRSGNYSLQITFGMRGVKVSQKSSPDPERQWYVTAHLGQKPIVRSASELSTALERLLNALRGGEMSPERLSNLAKLNDDTTQVDN